MQRYRFCAGLTSLTGVEARRFLLLGLGSQAGCACVCSSGDFGFLFVLAQPYQKFLLSSAPGSAVWESGSSKVLE